MELVGGLQDPLEDVLVHGAIGIVVVEHAWKKKSTWVTRGSQNVALLTTLKTYISLTYVNLESRASLSLSDKLSQPYALMPEAAVRAKNIF